MTSTDTRMKTRFQRVQALLQEAAGGKEPAYGGLRLWELSRDKLLEASLHGVRLIAPQQEPARASCCANKEEAPTRRSARSGLIQGLRGTGPFNGSRFPRLPWGAQPLQEPSIQLISDWIDDGCPDMEHSFPLETLFATSSQEPLQPLPTLEGQGTRIEAPNGYKYQQGELMQRMNMDCMTETQLEKLRYAFREMYELNKWSEDARSYNNFALIHQNHCQHGWERFLPWHRVHLYEFEQALQDHCPDVTLPYWDFTMPRYRPSQPDKGARIPEAMKAFLTEESLKDLADLPEGQKIPAEQITALGALIDKRFTSLQDFFRAATEFAEIEKKYTQGEYRNRFIDALLKTNSLWYPLRYPGEFHDKSGEKTINEAIHYHYPSAEDMEQILSLRTFLDFGGGSLYNDSFGFLEQNPHNTMHLWTGGMNPDYTESDGEEPPPEDRNRGVRVVNRRFHKREDLYSKPRFGDMFSNLTASYDPIFWLVHANVDRIWWEWQQRHPDSLPVDLDSILTPWSYTTRDTLDIHRFGYEYVKSTHLFAVGMGMPVGRFVSKSMPVPESVRTSFQKAEVRLHHVPQLPRSCFIRVFLNLPDATASTPMDIPNYAGYLAIFGHGPCIGGPGHCELPPARSRKYDLRPRSHNTPRNHRIDVTKAAKALLANGASSLQLTLVVIGVDYKEEKELLRLEGVSLNLLD